MIGEKLRQFCMALWLATAYPGRSGSSYIQRMQPVCYGGSMSGQLSKVDRDAMQEVLTNKYGIREIE